jgi:pimeloyl-ACP methyl ester carboxylesterase
MTPDHAHPSAAGQASGRDGEGSVAASDGVSLVWRLRLPGAKARAAVLLLHGGLEHGGRYLHVAARLADADLATYLPDLRGHGRSGGRPARIERMSLLVDDLGQMLACVSSRQPASGVWDDLHEIRCRTLILSGERDRLVSVDAVRDLVARIPASTLQVWPDVGHHPMLERTSIFNERVRRFVEAPQPRAEANSRSRSSLNTEARKGKRQGDQC